MEMKNERLIWRCACDDTVLQEEGTKILLRDIDKILELIITNPEESVIEYSEDGFKICDFPAFQINKFTESKSSRSGQRSYDSLDAGQEWTSIESTIRSVLSKVSKVPEKEINKHQTLYHLGLDSISAIKVAANLRQHTIKLSVGEMLKAADIEGMAKLVGVSSPEDSSLRSRYTIQSALSRLEPEVLLRNAGIDLDKVEKILPATAGQVYMLSMWQKSKGHLFFPTFQYQCSKDLNQRRLEIAWNQLLHHLQILRTTFVSTKDPSMPFVQAILNERLSSVVWNTTHRSKSISSKLAMLELNVQQTQQQSVLSLRIHHALYDGVSLPIIICRLKTFYNHLSPPSDHQLEYEDFVALGLDERNRSKGKDFWCSYLKDCRNPHLSLDKETGSSNQSERQALFKPALLPSTKTLLEFSRSNGLSIQSLFLAIYAEIYSEHLTSFSKEPAEDIVLGIYLANRSSLEGLASLPYPTFNLSPLRITRPSSHQPIIKTARQIQQDIQEISKPANARVGLWEIEAWTGVRVDCIVNFLSLPDDDDDDADDDADDNKSSRHDATERLNLQEITTDWEKADEDHVHDSDQQETFVDLPGAGNPVLAQYRVGVSFLLWTSRPRELGANRVPAFSRCRSHDSEYGIRCWCVLSLGFGGE
jgi:aryl carrier-like protein